MHCLSVGKVFSPCTKCMWLTPTKRLSEWRQHHHNLKEKKKKKSRPKHPSVWKISDWGIRGWKKSRPRHPSVEKNPDRGIRVWKKIQTEASECGKNPDRGIILFCPGTVSADAQNVFCFGCDVCQRSYCLHKKQHFHFKMQRVICINVGPIASHRSLEFCQLRW